WLYPPHLMVDAALAAFGGALSERLIDTLAVVHVAVAGLASSAVVRCRGLGSPAAAFAGVFVVLNGSTVSQSQHILMTETYAWLPLAVLVVDRLATGFSAQRIAALGVLFALMIAAGFIPLLPACALLL